MKNHFFIFLLLITCIASAQDTIVTKKGDIIKVKITEIGTEDIQFKIFGQQDAAVIIMKRIEIKKAIVGGQVIINEKDDLTSEIEDVIVKKTGDILKVKVMEIGTGEIKFKLFNNPDGPTISMLKSEIKTMKVNGQTVIDVKTNGLNEDIITKMDGTVIKAKIIEIGAGEIKYKLYSNPDGPEISVKKQDVNTVKINGELVYKHKDDPLSVSNKSILNKTSIVKFYFLSPFFHHLAVGYEWMDKPGFNWDVALGIIGPSVVTNDDRKPRGFFLRGGPKFLLGSSSDIVTEDTKERYAHPLKGKYIKIDLILNSFSSTNSIDISSSSPTYTTSKLYYKETCQSLAINIQYGKQHIFGNALTMEWYMGCGYSFENLTSTLPEQYKIYYNTSPVRYSHLYFGKDFPVVLTAGITIGLILPEKWAKNRQPYSKKPSPPKNPSIRK